MLTEFSFVCITFDSVGGKWVFTENGFYFNPFILIYHALHHSMFFSKFRKFTINYFFHRNFYELILRDLVRVFFSSCWKIFSLLYSAALLQKNFSTYIHFFVNPSYRKFLASPKSPFKKIDGSSFLFPSPHNASNFKSKYDM